MAGPFYNNIKGTTAVAAGTGAFTPNAAATGHSAWSTVPAGWMGLVRYEDGTAWGLSYGYWNGTTISRSATTFVSSSTGSPLTLTASATATMVADANEIQSHLGAGGWGAWQVQISTTTISAFGMPAPTANGAAAGVGIGFTTLAGTQGKIAYTSGATAGSLAGWTNNVNRLIVSTTAGVGGFEFVSRFGPSGTLPAGPRMFVGALTGGAPGTVEPSAIAQPLAMFAKDSTDANIQFMLNSNSVAGATKTDTGITLVSGGWYEATIWNNPGSLTMFGLLMRLDTGEIWYGSSATDAPASGTGMAPVSLLGTSNTTAIVNHIGSVFLRNAL